MIILPIPFKVKLLFELVILYTIFNMATSNLNEIIIYNQKNNALVAPALKKTSLIEQFYQHCSGTAIFLNKN